MKHDIKYSQALSKAIESGKAKRNRLAKEAFVSNSQMTKFSKGTAEVSNNIKKTFGNILKSPRLNLSAARSDFSIISFLHSKHLNHDFFSAETSADKEERERMELETAFREAIIKAPRYQTQADRDLINLYLENFVEEIGAEQNKLCALADYLNVDVQPIINSFNEALGG